MQTINDQYVAAIRELAEAQALGLTHKYATLERRIRNIRRQMTDQQAMEVAI